MALYEWFEGERVSDLVGTAVAEPVQSLHGDHCYAEVEVVEWSHRHGRQVTGTTLVLVCGWPAEHNPFLVDNYRDGTAMYGNHAEI